MPHCKNNIMDAKMKPLMEIIKKGCDKCWSVQFICDA